MTQSPSPISNPPLRRNLLEEHDQHQSRNYRKIHHAARKEQRHQDPTAPQDTRASAARRCGTSNHHPGAPTAGTFA